VRFLWQSNASWAGTGYGQQTGLILKELLKRGHEPALFAFYGLHGGVVEYDGYPVLPNSNYDNWGNDVVRAHLHRINAEAVITLIDLFVLDTAVWSTLGVPWVAWVPIDSETMGPSTIERLRLVNYPVAMSLHGAEQMRAVDIEPAAIIPHTVDTTIFKPMDKAECRAGLTIEDDVFLIGMVMANKGDRKQYPQQLRAVKEFSDANKDLDVRVFIHTEPTSAMGGWEMKALVDKLGLKGKVFTTNQYDTAIVPAKPELMARIYNSFDVLLNCSAGEGFGVPIIEAQACGVPVIAGNWTSMTALVHYGYLVEPAEKILSYHHGFHFIPKVSDIAYRLDCVYRMANSTDAAEAALWVEQNFNLEDVVDGWEAVIAYVEATQELKVLHDKAIPRPTPQLTETILDARSAMDAERKEYGEAHVRYPEYQAIHWEMQKYGFKDGDRILDLGAADADLDHYLRTEVGWRGVYTPVDLIIDGTDLRTYVPPNGYEFIVLEQVVEHLPHWKELVLLCEMTGAVVVIATPNGLVVPDHDKHDMEGQMAHVVWITPEELEGLGYEVTLKQFTGWGQGDTIIASKWTGERTNGERSTTEALRSGS
jgi:glycosyltransferase involved in cell wall biosynthesis